MSKGSEANFPFLYNLLRLEQISLQLRYIFLPFVVSGQGYRELLRPSLCECFPRCMSLVIAVRLLTGEEVKANTESAERTLLHASLKGNLERSIREE